MFFNQGAGNDGNRHAESADDKHEGQIEFEEAAEIGFEVDNDGNVPIVGVVMGGWEAMITACRVLWNHDILITPATFPAVPATRNLVRFSITAANTGEELDQAIRALRAVWEALHATPELGSAVAVPA